MARTSRPHRARARSREHPAGRAVASRRRAAALATRAPVGVQDDHNRHNPYLSLSELHYERYGLQCIIPGHSRTSPSVPKPLAARTQLSKASVRECRKRWGVMTPSSSLIECWARWGLDSVDFSVLMSSPSSSWMSDLATDRRVIQTPLSILQ